MNSSFKYEKLLRFTLKLGASTFGGHDADTVTLENFRSTAEIEHVGGMVMSTASCRIFGMSEGAMQQLTMLTFESLGVVRNTLHVEAIDGDVVSEVFQGQIINSWPDYQSAPDVYFHIEAQAGYYEQTAMSAPTSYKGSADVGTMIGKLARDAGYTFENNGVDVRLSNPYFSGSAMEQIKGIVAAAGINWILDPPVLAIWPMGSERNTMVPLISPDTGLVGYPTFDKNGIGFRCLYNSSIHFGGQVQVETSVPRAKGLWNVVGVSHSLSAVMPDGPWFTDVRCIDYGRNIAGAGI